MAGREVRVGRWLLLPLIVTATFVATGIARDHLGRRIHGPDRYFFLRAREKSRSGTNA